MLIQEAGAIDYVCGQIQHDGGVCGCGLLGHRAGLRLSAASWTTCLLPGNDAGMQCVGDERGFHLLPASLFEYYSPCESPLYFEPSAEPGAVAAFRDGLRFFLFPQ